MSKITERISMYYLPTVAMRGLVVFPGIPTSFDVTREASIKAIDKAKESDGRIFIVTQRDVSVDDPSRDDLYDVGIIAKVKQSLKLPDRQYRVIVEGESRAELVSLRSKNPLMCEVAAKDIDIEADGGLRTEALIRGANDALHEFLKYGTKLSNDVMLAIQTIKHPGFLCDFIAANISLKYQDKEALLAEFDPMRRIELLSLLLERETEVLKLESKINKKVKAQIDKNQRDYYLREQMKVIQNELGQREELYSDVDELAAKIEKASLPKEIEDKLYAQLSKLEKLPFGSSEAAIVRSYVDTCLEIPWGKTTRDRLDLKAAEKILNEDHDGLEKVKERVLEYLAVKALTPELKGQIICLVGAPGVGKSSVATSIAKALKRKSVRISLGGIRDEADIRGHRKTYIGSMPGRIINALVQAESMNPLIILDEIDKLTMDSHGDPSSALLEVLDSDQNKTFRDHFIELPVDISDCVFIATANTLDTIPRPLLDRMEVIRIQGYTKEEKMRIAKNHLIPKQLKRHGLNKSRLRITSDALSSVIDDYTKEQGVRNLERELAKICRKCARVIASGEKKSMTVGKKDLFGLLGKVKVRREKLEDEGTVGVVNGLAWTEVGGELLKVEAIALRGSGKLTLTGSLGDVMKESAGIAVSLIRSRSEELHVKNPEFYKECDLHLHFPEGAVPKDGPSAGIAITTALVSELCGIPVRRDVAMTGEITLHGKVLPIGGLREKTSAAAAAGIGTVIIPKDNLDDLDEVDPAVKEAVTFVAVSTIDEVLENALCRPENEPEVILYQTECTAGEPTHISART